MNTGPPPRTLVFNGSEHTQFAPSSVQRCSAASAGDANAIPAPSSKPISEYCTLIAAPSLLLHRESHRSRRRGAVCADGAHRHLIKVCTPKVPVGIRHIEIDVRMVVLVFGRLPRSRLHLDAVFEDGHLARGRVGAEH